MVTRTQFVITHLNIYRSIQNTVTDDFACSWNIDKIPGTSFSNAGIYNRYYMYGVGYMEMLLINKLNRW